MRLLTISEYNEAESEAIGRLPNRIIEAFQPLTFKNIGYPTQIKKESELVKYVDVMQENLFDEYFNKMLGGLTIPEFDLYQKLIGKIADFSESWFNELRIPKGTVLQSMNVLRHIKYIFGDAKPKVFEFGPGSGYLGALLLLDGYSYASIDVTQAFYILQNHIWNYVSGGKVKDGANRKITNADITNLKGGEAVHYPWWEFGTLDPSDTPKFEVVTCNHALCEMHESSLRFSQLISREFLRADAIEKRIFIFQGWGLSTPDSRAVATMRFYERGFKLVHNDLQIAVFVPADTVGAFNHMHQPDLDGGFRPHEFSNDQNIISRSITDGRLAIEEKKVIPLAQLKTLLTLLLGDIDHRTPDEKFSEMLGYYSYIGSQAP